MREFRQIPLNNQFLAGETAVIMQTVSLNGAWQLRQDAQQQSYPATVPGCNFLDLMANGVIPDPFLGANENDVQWVPQKDWVYSRTFTAPEDLLFREKVDLKACCLDTLATVSINGQKAGEANNSYRTWRFDVKRLLRAGENTIEILFRSPMPYLKERQKLVNMPNSTMGEAGSQHIRKTPSHFGWDWGPHLPPAGISGDILLEAYDTARLDDVTVRQLHKPGKVTLRLFARLSESVTGGEVRFTLTGPDGETQTVKAPVEHGEAKAQTAVLQPKLWWCSGLGEQPLYSLHTEFLLNGEAMDERKMTLGLRTVTLDTSKDQWGSNFCFQVNGVPIFAKGANWIPSDSFATRTDEKKLEYFILAAKNANMNMIRVWGGGYYESDTFYELCNRHGLLVWQDFMFACSAYPFMLDDFTENVRHEVIDNVKRLRHHPCLCLWCGNNEIESMSMPWSYRRDIIKSTGTFFYETLRGWVKDLDDVTPYWACTPSSGEYMKKINNDNFGDTHLWHVWHGLRPVEFYRKRMTRFCSEFGLESLPSVKALEKFAKPEDYALNSKVFLQHQKCAGGNDKMLYYVLSRFRQPKNFIDLVYLTQLAQMECVRDATEHWRRNRGRCNGSLYWQLNDCWPVNSWAGMDYYGNYKVVQYAAKHFNEPVAVSLENNGCRIGLHVINDTREPVKAICRWTLQTFEGKVLKEGQLTVNAKPLTASRLTELNLEADLPGNLKNKTVFAAYLEQDGQPLSKRTALMVKENACAFPRPNYSVNAQIDGETAKVTITSDRFARFVQVELRGVDAPLSDNYFDLLAGESITVTAPVKKGTTPAEVESGVKVFSLVDVEPKTTLRGDKLKKAGIALIPVNTVNWIARFFDN